jgi:predicted permease
MRIFDHADAIRQDVAFSLRQIRRAPAFAAAVIVTLGLGIGANATMFGAIDQLLLRPPAHVADPARLVTAALRDMRRDPTHVQRVLSFPIYEDLSRTHDAFTRVGIYRNATVDFGSGAQMMSVPAVLASGSYFDAIGVAPLAGRFFSDRETSDAAAVAVLGYEFWQSEFGGDSAVIGRRVQLAGAPHTIVGIAPENFTGVEPTKVDVFLPLTDGMPPAAVAGLSRRRQSYAYLIVGRLAPGVSLDVAANIATAAVQSGERMAGATEAQTRALGRRVELTSTRPSDARGATPEARVAELLGAVSLFVLLLSCANVMNLQLARGLRRRREIAVRIALGVSRGRLIRQLALDCLLLSLAGGATGVLVAQTGGRLLRQTLLGEFVGTTSPIDGRVLSFAFVVAVVTGLVTGLIPAAELLRSDLAATLREGSRGGESARTGRLRAVLLVSQAALTTVLLAGTGLFVLSLRRIEAMPLGFDPSHAAVARLNLSGRHAQPFSGDDGSERAQTLATFQRLETVARETPGVTSAAIALTAPFEGGYAAGLKIPGHDSVPVTREGGPYFNAVSADYFKVIGAELVAGRAFTSSDQRQSAGVAIVNETAARLWWPGENALGRCLELWDDSTRCAEVVGVVHNTRRLKIVEDDYVQLFVPIDQAGPLAPGVVVFRTADDPQHVIPVVQRRLQVAAAGLPFVNVRPLASLVAPRMRSWKLGAAMFSVFAGLALALGAIGLYSVLAYDVAQRRQELGVRRALGALARNIAGLVMRRGLSTTTLGVLVGIGISLAAGRFVEPLLFQTSTRDPLVYAAVALVVALVSATATLVPAWRAAQVDPNVALRGD